MARTERKIEIEDFFKEPNFFVAIWWKIQNLVENWVYPAYKIRHFLFNRQDFVRLPGVSKTEWCDVVERMFLANMQLLAEFVEKEKPEEYVCWYKDDNGADVGHKYGECENFPPLYPEYNGKYIMDIIKEVYHWWKVDYPKLCEEQEYLLSFWCDYVCGKMKSKRSKVSEEYNEIVFDTSECPKTLDYFNDKEIKWDILDKYLEGDRNNIFVERFVNNKLHELKTEIELQKQKNLHLCIEVRQYLWT